MSATRTLGYSHPSGREESDRSALNRGRPTEILPSRTASVPYPGTIAGSRAASWRQDLAERAFPFPTQPSFLFGMRRGCPAFIPSRVPRRLPERGGATREWRQPSGSGQELRMRALGLQSWAGPAGCGCPGCLRAEPVSGCVLVNPELHFPSFVAAQVSTRRLGERKRLEERGRSLTAFPRQTQLTCCGRRKRDISLYGTQVALTRMGTASSRSNPQPL